MQPTDKPDKWWKIFQRAAKLRDRLGVIEATTERELKRAQIAQIKREAFELLHDADIPDPFRMLIVDLWGGSKGFLGRLDKARLTAAAIEGQHPVDLTGQRPRVADACRAAVADEVEAELL